MVPFLTGIFWSVCVNTTCCCILLGGVLWDGLGCSNGNGDPTVAGQNSGAVPWVVGNDGCLCDVYDPAAISAALLATSEPSRYSELSGRALAAVRYRFTTTAVVDQFVELYKSYPVAVGESLIN